MIHVKCVEVVLKSQIGKAIIEGFLTQVVAAQDLSHQPRNPTGFTTSEVETPDRRESQENQPVKKNSEFHKEGEVCSLLTQNQPSLFRFPCPLPKARASGEGRCRECSDAVGKADSDMVREPGS